LVRARGSEKRTTGLATSYPQAALRVSACQSLAAVAYKDDCRIDVDIVMNDQIDDLEKQGPKLVSENSPEKVKLLRKREAADRAAAEARQRVRVLVANILRIIAGAGEPVSTAVQMHDALKAYLDWSKAAEEATGCGINDDQEIWSPLRLDSLFPHEHRDPQTEEEWQEWALENPQRDYIRERDRQMDRIRQIVLREIAAEMAGIEMHSRKYNGDYRDAINRICDEHEKYRKTQGKPVKSNPTRVQFAEQAIAGLREREQQKAAASAAERREKMVANLQEHQVRGLRAVLDGSEEALAQTDAFTLDVLGGMGLLQRIKGVPKSKRAWQVTELGRRAVDHHKRDNTN
jgi:hypothetical protein